MHGGSIPSFYLYGEPHRAVEEGFVHAERLDDRSRPSEWTILPHAHADLVQLFVVDRGGGEMRAEDARLAVGVPALLLIPSGVVHGFSWQQESAGSVVTLSMRHLSVLDVRYPGMMALFGLPRVIPLDAAACAAIGAGVTVLMRELGWAAPGHDAAVDAALLGILVETWRAGGPPAADTASLPGQQGALVARFRARIDERFRLREPIAVHAAALGVSESRLRTACAQVARLSPAAMLDQRAILEVKRALLYTNLSVAEVGYAAGFADPAYFTRFFTRHAGVSPRAFRSRESKVA
ncbi:helix-turn-helix domain-containing protein [Sphingomonas carotinifaciens]|uniref:Helix-turn-helix domain-containing protein n=1 Tax=Sphingomonas carotinifaciens TaxID=1166323 RepID=A0A1G7PQG6_9SPHN|nr:helix-turn-helix domain-containing protein [Sphingomonas carotinifaciens]MBB4087461.1 AraC family transcriptional activator of pobA [Sphingomonas carotinifaciens]MWC45731.1 helix-turn-helix domain-containing protein [Sphingomonas carotinifaciens]SDF88455.1 transcriptional regulator, AraC family [Sphingomonas carotinifaciens]